MLRKGYKAEDIAPLLAVLLDCSEKIIERKLKNTREFTFQEVLKINSEIFKIRFTNLQRVPEVAPFLLLLDLQNLYTR